MSHGIRDLRHINGAEVEFRGNVLGPLPGADPANDLGIAHAPGLLTGCSTSPGPGDLRHIDGAEIEVRSDVGRRFSRSDPADDLGQFATVGGEMRAFTESIGDFGRFMECSIRSMAVPTIRGNLAFSMDHDIGAK